MNKNKNIFESVEFIGGINEGVIGGVLALLSLPIVLTTIIVAGSEISSNVERARIRKVLTDALNSDKDLLPLKKKLKKGTRIISVNKLAQQVKISDKDINIINNHDISVMTIIDIEDNIIAYCLISPMSNKLQYGYTIVDKSLPKNKSIDAYLRATFEFKLGVYGDGIKYFTKVSKNIYFYARSKNTTKDLHRTANYISKEESYILYEKIREFAHLLFKKIKSTVIDGITVDSIDSYDNGSKFYINLHSNELSEVSYEEFENNEKEIFKKDTEMMNIIKDNLNSILRPFGYTIVDSNEGYRSIFMSEQEEYKLIIIALDYTDDFGYYTIDIYTARQLRR